MQRATLSSLSKVDKAAFAKDRRVIVEPTAEEIAESNKRICTIALNRLDRWLAAGMGYEFATAYPQECFEQFCADHLTALEAKGFNCTCVDGVLKVEFLPPPEKK